MKHILIVHQEAISAHPHLHTLRTHNLPVIQYDRDESLISRDDCKPVTDEEINMLSPTINIVKNVRKLTVWYNPPGPLQTGRDDPLPLPISGNLNLFFECDATRPAHEVSL
jgi:hypothetical protein